MVKLAIDNRLTAAGMSAFRRESYTLGYKHRLKNAVNDKIGLETADLLPSSPPWPTGESKSCERMYTELPGSSKRKSRIVPEISYRRLDAIMTKTGRAN
jgi:hypothetical protein